MSALPAEARIDLVSALTTKPSSFLSEPGHFHALHHLAASAVHAGETFRIWSAGCSMGEEAYSRVLATADKAMYPVHRTSDMPAGLLFIGHSESLMDMRHIFQCAGPATYRKK